VKSGTPSAARLEAALGVLFPPGVACAVWMGGGEPELAGPREREAVARAVPSRRAEFARGRACARQALALAGWSGALPELPVGPSRAPVWPTGYTGSITHCEGVAAAVVAPARLLRSLGLDAEPARPLPAEVGPSVLVEGERAASAAGGPLYETIVFSAKESVHKAVHPPTGIWLDFLDVTLAVEPPRVMPGAGAEGGRFRAASSPGATARAPDLDALIGGYLLIDGWVLTSAYLPATQGALAGTRGAPSGS